VFIYVGKTFNATATGTVIKEVNCEKCALRFYYELARVAAGEADAPYYMGQGSAEERAQRRAQQNLAGKLQVDCEVVPCPQCGHVQQAMVRFLRGRMYRTLRVLTWVLPIAGLVLTWVMAAMAKFDRPRHFEEERVIYVLVAAGFVGLWFVLMSIKRWLLARGHWLRAAMSAAPPALLPEDRPNADGAIPLRPVRRRQLAEIAPRGDWVIIPLLRMSLPPLCCGCMQPATTVYRSPFKVYQDFQMEIPLCRPCMRQLGRRWWKIFAVTVIVCLAIASLVPVLSVYSSKSDPLGRWRGGVFTAFFLILLAGGIIPSLLAKPCRVRFVDAQRGIVRMRFRNPQYIRLLQQMATALDSGSTMSAPPLPGHRA